MVIGSAPIVDVLGSVVILVGSDRTTIFVVCVLCSGTPLLHLHLGTPLGYATSLGTPHATTTTTLTPTMTLQPTTSVFVVDFGVLRYTVVKCKCVKLISMVKSLGKVYL